MREPSAPEEKRAGTASCPFAVEVAASVAPKKGRPINSAAVSPRTTTTAPILWKRPEEIPNTGSPPRPNCRTGARLHTSSSFLLPANRLRTVRQLVGKIAKLRGSGPP